MGTAIERTQWASDASRIHDAHKSILMSASTSFPASTTLPSPQIHIGLVLLADSVSRRLK